MPRVWKLAATALRRWLSIAGAFVLTRTPTSTYDHTGSSGSVSIDVAGFPRGALAGEPAPDMSVAMFDGSRFVMSEYRASDGRPLVLNLWASWCPPLPPRDPGVLPGGGGNPAGGLPWRRGRGCARARRGLRRRSEERPTR